MTGTAEPSAVMRRDRAGDTLRGVTTAEDHRADADDLDVAGLLTAAADDLLDKASERLRRVRLPHYDDDGHVGRERLTRWFDLVVQTLSRRDLTVIVTEAEALARERFEQGVPIEEVQTAFNVLEETIWQHVVSTTPPERLARAIGLVSTVLGVGKDAMARTYVALAAQHHVPSLDLTALFQGPSEA